ncbi:hypothetical protein DSECCO2_528250 [anaerobic digester metagenome]
MEHPDVFHVGEGHAVAADAVAGIRVARGDILGTVTADGVDAADVEAFEHRDFLAILGFQHHAAAHASVQHVVGTNLVVLLGLGRRLEEVVVTHQEAAAVFGEYLGDIAPGRVIAAVGGVAGDAAMHDAGHVIAFAVPDDLGGVVLDVVQLVEVEPVTPAHGGVFPDGVGKADGVADGVLAEVRELVTNVVGVVAHRQVGIVVARVGERPLVGGAATGEQRHQRGLVALAEQVALHDGAGHAELVVGGVTHATDQRPGVLFLHLDLQVHFILMLGGHQFGGHAVEVLQLVQAFRAAAQLLALEHVAVGDAQFSQDDVVAGLVVAFHQGAADVHLLPLAHGVGHVHHGFVLVLPGAGGHLGEGIAVVGVKIGKGLVVFLHHVEAEEPVFLLHVVQLDDFGQAGVGLDEVASESHLAQLVARAFLDGEGDDDAVLFVVHLGGGHHGVEVAVVHAVGGDGGGIALQMFVLEHAGPGDPREHAALGQRQLLSQVVGIQLFNTFEGHLLDVQLLAFLHLQHQAGPRPARARIYAVRNLGQVVAFLAVEFGNLLQVLRKQLFVEDRTGLGAHGGKNVVHVHLVRALYGNVFDARLFLHRVHEDQAFAVLLHVGLHVAEVAKIPDALHFAVDGGRVHRVALAGGQAHQHHVWVQHLGAAHLDVGQGVAAQQVGRDALGQFVHGRQDVDEPFLLNEEGARGADAQGVHHAHVDAEAFAHLVEAAVNGNARARQNRQVARGGHVQVGHVLVAHQGLGVLPGNDGKPARHQALRDEFRQVVVEIFEVRSGIHLEGQDDDGGIPRRLGRRGCRVCEHKQGHRKDAPPSSESGHTALRL